MSTHDILMPLPFQEWPVLAESLKVDWPIYAQYSYFVQNAIQWKSKEPDFPSTIYSPEGNLESGVFVAPFCSLIIMFACKGSEALLYKAVTETKHINWTEDVIFFPNNPDILPIAYTIIETLERTTGLQLEWNHQGYVYYKPKEECAAMKVRVPEGCYLDKINTSHVHQIHSVWPHRDEEHPEITTKLIMARVRLNGGLGLFSEDNHELLSWVLQSELGELCCSQTIEKCRRKGFSKAVRSAYAKELAENGRDSICTIVGRNFAAESMAKSLNYRRLYLVNAIRMNSPRTRTSNREIK